MELEYYYLFSILLCIVLTIDLEAAGKGRIRTSKCCGVTNFTDICYKMGLREREEGASSEGVVHLGEIERHWWQILEFFPSKRVVESFMTVIFEHTQLIFFRKSICVMDGLLSFSFVHFQVRYMLLNFSDSPSNWKSSPMSEIIVSATTVLCDIVYLGWDFPSIRKLKY